ncbi:MAG TPA: gamma carbonic anhydrase family protein [Deltaproteobacteria bacterium]|nr:gamma carbonic anhydrase family protein [Deltaproteobacteria bacterium]HOM28822.1 gamma carbonic anhydrase family protein [Deltaproteobacteria bacterium]HPP79554.1 gamma carbonic anhydrase family protein [Deltaproteobacteria bacterium]
MPLYALGDKAPLIGADTWVAPSAEIIGDVTIGERCWIGPCAVIRGDFGSIVIGDDTAIEDGVVVHTPAMVTIGSFVTIGHLAMIHGASVGDYAVIGMNSTLGDNARVGEWAIVAEHSLVKKNQVVPPGKLYAGVPAVEKGEVTQVHREVMIAGKKLYRDLAGRYREGLRRIG